jgi:anaerobic dimethyl sulfoxide reductase subunit A
MDDRDRMDRIVTTSCAYDCGARCIIRVHIEDGRIERISTDDGPLPGLRACPRGLAWKDVVYARDRLTQPLRRAGQRGSGEFVPISWDEALETVAGQLQRVKGQYGPTAIFLMDHCGSLSPLHGVLKAARRFFAMFGGCTTWWGNSSREAATFASMATYGTIATGNTPDSFLHSRIIILWGWNPVVTRFGPQTVYYLAQAKKAGARVIVVDPRYTASAEALAEQWIPLRPGTDAAMLIAMAHVVISEGLADRRFIDTYTVGFEMFSDYVLGREDGVPKTAQWAADITGVPEATIQQLARDYATMRPAALCASWAPGRTAFGEQYHRAASALTAITGNIGIPGGFASGGVGRLPMGGLGLTLPVPDAPTPLVHGTELFDTLLKGKIGGYPSDIKLLYLVGSNLLNQFPNTNKGVAALQQPEFVVAHDLFLTPTARHADIVLPVCSAMERTDIAQPWGGGPYLIHMEKAIEPLHETKSDLAIFTELASRLGIEGYNDKREEDWLREFAAATPDLPDYDEFAREGVHHIPIERPLIAFREQIADPANHPFPTPSGKIELYSRMLAERNDPLTPPIPTFIEPWEGPGDRLAARYPIQLVSPHSRARVNSSLHNIPRLKALADDDLWLNVEDARARGIATADTVRIFNDRGTVVASARVSDHIMRGVASLDAGAWFAPDDEGTDQGGCGNVLTRDKASPAGSYAFNTCLVQVEKME